MRRFLVTQLCIVAFAMIPYASKWARPWIIGIAIGRKPIRGIPDGKGGWTVPAKYLKPTSPSDQAKD